MREFENEIEVMCKVKFHYSKGYPATHEDPGCPNECEDIEIEVLPFDDQPKDIQESIIDQCFECVENDRQYAEECKAEAHLESLKGGI